MNKTHDEYRDKAANILKAELKKRAMTYDDLAKTLTIQMEIPCNKKKIANKLYQGDFKTSFFFQCLDAIGVTIRFE